MERSIARPGASTEISQAGRVRLWAAPMAVFCIGLYFAAVVLAYMNAMPVFEASDEAAHALYVHNLLEDRALPVIPSRAEVAQLAADGDLVGQWSIESHQPPLYYALGALLVSGTQREDIDSYLRPNDLIFIRANPEHNSNKWLHAPGPATGDTASAVMILRAFSLSLSLLTLVLIYQAARLVTGSAAAGLTAMLLVASIPTYVAVSGSVTNDNLVTLLYTAGVYWSLYTFKHGIRARDVLIISAILAATAITKITGLSLFGVVYLGLLLGWRRGRFTFRQAAAVVATSLTLAAVAAGWWYLRNWSLYGDPLALDATRSLWGREFAVAAESDGGLGELSRLWSSFWMMGGHLHWPVFGPLWFYLYTTLITLAGAAGLLIAFTRRHRPDAVVFALLGAASLLPLAQLLLGTRSVDISYGRLLFPALVGLAPLLVIGWRAWAKRLAPLLIVPLAVMALLFPARYLPDGYPMLTPVGIIPESAVPVNVCADALCILAYERHTDVTAPADDIRMTLYLSGPHPQNPALYTALIDPVSGDVLGRQAMYPGSAPTDALVPGAIYRAPLRLFVDDPSAPLPPRLLRVEFSWQASLSDTDLPLLRGDGTPVEALLLDAATMIDPGYAAVAGSPAHSADADFGGAIALRGFDLSAETVAPGDTLDLRLYWEPVGGMDRDWVATVQMLGPDGALLAQADGDVPGYPTSAWQTGAPVVDARSLTIPADAPPGDYRLWVGWYRPEGDSFIRLPARSTDAASDLVPLPLAVTIRSE